MGSTCQSLVPISLSLSLLDDFVKVLGNWLIVLNQKKILILDMPTTHNTIASVHWKWWRASVTLITRNPHDPYGKWPISTPRTRKWGSLKWSPTRALCATHEIWCMDSNLACDVDISLPKGLSWKVPSLNQWQCKWSGPHWTWTERERESTRHPLFLMLNSYRFRNQPCR